MCKLNVVFYLDINQGKYFTNFLVCGDLSLFLFSLSLSLSLSRVLSGLEIFGLIEEVVFTKSKSHLFMSNCRIFNLKM